MKGLLYYNAKAFAEGMTCNYCGMKIDDDGAWVYKENFSSDDVAILHFCCIDCAEGFSRLNNMKEEE